MTRHEIAACFPDYDIEIFDVDMLRIVKNVSGYCLEHYKLIMQDDEGIVFRTDEKLLDDVEIMRIEVRKENLDEEAASALKEGIVFDSLDEINRFIENAE